MSEESVSNLINSASEIVKDKAVSLYEFLKEMSALKSKAIINVSDYSWKMYFKDCEEDAENIHIFYRDRIESEDETRDPVILSVHKPEFKGCPNPPKHVRDWLLDGWDDYHKEVEVKSSISRVFSSLLSEKFDDDKRRVQEYNEWLTERREWQKSQRIAAKTRAIFTDLYETYNDLNREIETMEIVVANGFLRDKENPSLNHPIVTRRVNLRFDAHENTIYVEDTDVDSNLYTILLQRLENVNLDFVSNANMQLRKNDYHPLDRNDFPDYLKAFVHQLSSDSIFSKDGLPNNWEEKNRFLLYCSPVLIFRKRIDGTPLFIQNVIENINDSGWVPNPVSETVSGGKIDIEENEHELTIDELLAQVGGEDTDILLAKEANREQLEIAQRINMYNAVLVQGPPGTGKTHTIANLMGHFLAEGKSILVTSQTPKALQVLKDKLPDNIKPLCVSILNDSNIDMEKSVEGISSFMSRHTANELKKEAEQLQIERKEVINKLADVRRKLFEVMHKENNSFVYEGEEISPSKAAEFVLANTERLSDIIPGKVEINAPLPLTIREFIDLYRSNDDITKEEEKELSSGIPSTDLLIDKDTFGEFVEEYKSAEKRLELISKDLGYDIRFQKSIGTIIDTQRGSIKIPCTSKEELSKTLDEVQSFGGLENWMKYAAVDGCKGGAYAKRWVTLIEEIEKTSAYSESIVSERFGKEVEFKDIESITSNKKEYEKLSEIFERKGKVSKLDFFADKNLKTIIDLVSINGEPIGSKGDCDLVIHQIELNSLRKQCAAYWNELMKNNGEPDFFSLDPKEPENVAKGWAEVIRKSLSWHNRVFGELADKLEKVGIKTADFICVNRSDNALQQTEKILDAIMNVIPNVINACIVSCDLYELKEKLERTKTLLKDGDRGNSSVCASIADAIENMDVQEYCNGLSKLEYLYDKYKLQSDRRDFLYRLSAVAPEWADAIQNRKGIHGGSEMPHDLEDAWKWKQYSGMISNLLSTPYDTLQENSILLGKRYRELTGKYAENLAWYNLLKRTENDLDMRQALNGWRLTVKKIGKGTGKSAPKYKAQAKLLMAKCQNAVPAWIMPMSRVIETLDPRTNSFDVVIVDEASQSDVSALGVMYLGKKVIIVGDDKQVSPMGIGSDTGRIESLEKIYIKDVIPNSHLYSANTSLYDIAATTYQPLMLREHFRCVPDIIGFSNMLSYDYKIKPLRDSGSSTIVPAVVNYRVNGVRIDRSNIAEAKSIVALIKACIEQPEYAGKTFGVISLLGDEQAKKINKLIYKYISPQDIASRKILCGNPAHFQGDERDVIFLSLVDSTNGDGPLSKMEFGSNDAYRKRYNVAASRAKDQLWVVDSLDAENDLKPGDIRKRLIEYSQNPHAFEEIKEEIIAKADSPFEVSVASELVARGYKIIQQWQVGAYRIDMVAVCGGKHIAIECDGEAYHSGDAKIREDMERQTILERSGWRFIRIRGSEYYSNPKGTIEKVVERLHIEGIDPEFEVSAVEEASENSLLKRVKDKAYEIVSEFDEEEKPGMDVIRMAYRV